MAVLSVHVDDITMARLERASRELDRSVEDLAECAIAEAALDAERRQPRGNDQ